jgi:hypothetical protein
MGGSESAAKRLAARIARGEITEPGLYADGALGWHNTDEVWAPMADAPLRMAAVRTVAPDFHAEDLELHSWAGGFAVQYVFVGKLVGGADLRIVGCIVARVDDGQFTRLQEYVDSAHAAPLAAALAKLSGQ